jgi:BMFP domain-containing protein YqiC
MARTGHCRNLASSTKASKNSELPETAAVGQSPASKRCTTSVHHGQAACSKNVQRTTPAKAGFGACYTAGHFFSFSGQPNMLAPKALLDALSDQASRLFSSDTAQPRAELESQFKVLMQGAFSKLDLVSREEFDSQMVVLARTRARLEALEKQVAELEARMAPPTQESQSTRSASA